jgi:hypothetical protein
VIDCEFQPREPNSVDSRRPSADMGFSRAAETDAVRRILILDKTVRPIPNSGARNAPRGSLSRNGFLIKSNGLRHGGCALKGLSEDLRFHDDRRRLDRRVLRHGKRRPPWRITHLFRQATDRFRRLSVRLLDTSDDRAGKVKAVVTARWGSPPASRRRADATSR